jgi:hypothetical protein
VYSRSEIDRIVFKTYSLSEIYVSRQGLCLNTRVDLCLCRNDILLAVDVDTHVRLTEKLCEGVPDCQETMAKACNLSTNDTLFKQQEAGHIINGRAA